MAETQQRSLRETARQSGVSHDRARAAVRRGHVDPDNLAAADRLVLRVSAMLTELHPFGEIQRSGASATRDSEAIRLTRASQAATLPQIATLVITADTVRLATTLADVTAATMEPTTAGIPHLVLPIGAWSAELSQQLEQGAA